MSAYLPDSPAFLTLPCVHLSILVREPLGSFLLLKQKTIRELRRSNCPSGWRGRTILQAKKGVLRRVDRREAFRRGRVCMAHYTRLSKWYINIENSCRLSSRAQSTFMAIFRGVPAGMAHPSFSVPINQGSTPAHQRLIDSLELLQ